MKAYRLAVMVIAATIATLQMVETSKVARKKFDIAIVVDWRPLRGETGWTMRDNPGMSQAREKMVDTIVSATQELEKEFDLKIGIFTYNGDLPQDQFFGDPSETKSTLELVLSGATDLADNLIGDDISQDILKVKESLVTDDRKNRPEAEDIVFWVTVAKHTTQQDESASEELRSLAKKLFNSANGGVASIFTIDWVTTGDTGDDYSFRQLVQTPTGLPELIRVAHVNDNVPGVAVRIVKKRISDYLSSRKSKVPPPKTRQTEQLQAWHIVLITLGATALISLVVIVIVIIVIIAGRSGRTHHRHPFHNRRRRSPNRRDTGRGHDTCDNRLSRGADRTRDDSRFSDRSRDDYRSPARPSVDSRRR